MMLKGPANLMLRPTVRRSSPRSVIAWLFMSLLAGSLAACGADSSLVSAPPPARTDGWLTVELSTPRSDDGAVQFQVTGPGVDSTVVTNYDGFALVQNGVASVIVTGNVGSGWVARVHVPDLARATEYRASVVAAAARRTFALQDVTSYRAVLVR